VWVYKITAPIEREYNKGKGRGDNYRGNYRGNYREND
jgi:hypothetical protein